jgi:hypothetical protein
MTVLIVYLYSDGACEADPYFKERMEGALSIDELINMGWRVTTIGCCWREGKTRAAHWTNAVLVKD